MSTSSSSRAELSGEKGHTHHCVPTFSTWNGRASCHMQKAPRSEMHDARQVVFRESRSNHEVSSLLLCWATFSCAIDERTVVVTPTMPGRDASSSAVPEDRDSGTEGSGGTSCAAPCELPHASAVCAGSACLIAGCIGPFRDANGQPEDGCELGDIPENGLGLWFLADRGVIAQGGLVSAWVDQSPNGITA